MQLKSVLEEKVASRVDIILVTKFSSSEELNIKRTILC